MYEHQRAMIPDTTHPVAATQFPITNSPASNHLLAESVIRLAATEGGARIILLPKLFDNSSTSPYHVPSWDIIPRRWNAIIHCYQSFAI